MVRTPVLSGGGCLGADGKLRYVDFGCGKDRVCGLECVFNIRFDS